MSTFIQILSICAPILVAVVGIIPTVISNRKKTEQTIKESQEAAKKDMEEMRATIKESQDAAKKDAEKIKAKLDAHIREDEDGRARNQRYRILRFYDEMCEHRDHSESHFEDILDDIDDYEKYCESHPQFRNNRGQVAMAYIKDMYAKIKNSGGFLTHDPVHPTIADE